MSSDHLKLAVLEIKDLLKSLAKGEQFDETLIKSFGVGLNTEAAENLRQQWTVGDFSQLPEIEIRSASELNGANGGFSTYTNHIYLSKEFLGHNSYSSSAITSVLLEEIGHFIDSKVNTVDAAGDEGAIFSALVRGENLSAEQLQVLKIENDFTTANIDGSSIVIEQAATYTGSNLGESVNELSSFFSSLQDKLDTFTSSTSLPLLGTNLGTNTQFKWLDSLSSSIKSINTLSLTTSTLISQINSISGLSTSNLSETADAVSFDLAVKSNRTLTSNLASKLGLSWLGLDIAGSAAVGANFNTSLKVTINKTSSPTVKANSDLQVGIDASLSNSFSAVGKIGLLQVEAKDDQANPNGSSLKANLVIDTDGNANSFTVDNANSNIKFDLKTSLPSVSFLGSNFSLPTITSDLDFIISNGGVTGANFNNVNVSLGTNFLSGLRSTIDKVLKPIQPFIDLLSKDIAPISKYDTVRKLFDKNNDNKVTLVDFIYFGDQLNGTKYGSNVDSFLKAVRDIKTLNSGTTLFNSTGFSLSSNSTANYTSGININNQPGLYVPIINNKTVAYDLLRGIDVPLFSYQLPKLNLANFKYDQFTPLVGPLGVNFGVDLNATAQFGFGYDTYGLKQFISTNDSGKIKEGFYISDRQNVDGTGADIAEIILGSRIRLEGGASIAVAKAFAGGNISGTVNFNLHDANGDGKIRTSEIPSDLSNLFDINANISAGVQAWVEVNYFLGKKRWDWSGAEVKLIDINRNGSSPTQEAFKPILAGSTAGVLNLYVGTSASSRNVNQSEINESFQISLVSSKINVKAFGQEQVGITSITKVLALAGSGNDLIELDKTLTVVADFDGGIGNDNLSGGAGNDTLKGGDGNDLLSGRGGNDLISGDAGNDVLDGGDGNDNLTGGLGEDRLFGGIGVDTLTGGDNNDQLSGDEDNDVLNGGQGQDNLQGGGGNDNLDGGTENDILSGNDGDDTLLGSSGDDKLYGGIGNDKLSGGDGNDQLVGEVGNDSLKGDSGNDVLMGGVGLDTLEGGINDDYLDGGTENDTLYGNEGNDVLVGGSNDDRLEGGEGIDQLDGGADNDTLLGGTQNDILFGGAGNDRLEGNENDDQIWGQSGLDTLLGGAGSDRLYGGTENENDILSGGTENDYLEGGDGNDTLWGGDLNLGDNDIASGGDDTLIGGAGNDKLYGGVGSDRLEGESGNDELYGNAGNDTIIGGQGIDSLSGGAGTDSLSGGTENDILSGGTESDRLEGNEGDDQLWGGKQDDTLKGEGDDTLTGGGNDTLLGGDGNDKLYGGVGSDRLEGEADNDELYGNLGNDTLIGSFGLDTLFGGADNDFLDGADDADILDGGAGTDILDGGQGNDTLKGAAGNDTLYGEAGNDNLDGGSEDDLLIGGIGQDTLSGNTGADQLFGGYDNDKLYGNDGADFLYGEQGNDSIEGGADADQIEGNEGDDLLKGDGGKDTLLGAEGNDNLYGGTENDSLDGGEGQDILAGETGSDRLEGNEGDDQLWGGKQDILKGQGDDILTGGGDDTLLGGAGNDILYGGLGSDRLEGGYGNDELYGNAGSDRLEGDDGDDKLQGGDGGDTLAGGDGKDLLVGDESNDPNLTATKSGNDSLEGGAGDDRLFGYLGNDILVGGTGKDWLEGGFGDDTIYSVSNTTPNDTDTDADVFVLAPSSGTDTIYGFDPKKDIIYLSNGLTFAFIKIVGDGLGNTNIFDLDEYSEDNPAANKALAILMGIKPEEITRANVDEENVEPNRLEFESKKPIYAKDETVTLVNTVVRDVNGADDLERIDFWLQKDSGNWQDISDVGFKGIDGSAVWGDYNKDGRMDLLVAGYNDKANSYPIRIYKNNANGSFSEVQFDLPELSAYRRGVTWGDYDKDGDLDILGSGYIIPNYDGDFYRDTIIHVSSISSPDKTALWKDYDNDGDLDLLLSGTDVNNNSFHKLYTYSNYTFAESDLNLGSGLVAWEKPPLSPSLNIFTVDIKSLVTPQNKVITPISIDWYDYNKDKYLDFVLTGSTPNTSDSTKLDGITLVYKGSSNGTFTLAAELTGVVSGDAAWGETKNGNVSLLISGASNQYRTRATDLDKQVRIPIAEVYQYQTTTQTFVKTTTNLAGVYSDTQGSHVSWQDYDKDGDLDILLTGKDFFDNPATLLYRNDAGKFVNAVFNPLATDPRLSTFNYSINGLTPGDYVLKGTAYDHQTAAPEYNIIPGSGEGVGNGALVLDGVDDYVEIKHNSSLNLTKFTIEAWVKLSQIKADYQTIITKQNADADYRNYGIYLLPNSNLIHVTFNGNGNYIGYNTTHGIDLNKFTHIAATYDGTKLSVYINGQLDGSTDYVGSPRQNNDSLIIGKEPSGTTNSPFSGQIDEVRVWNVARSQQQIQENMNRPLTGTQTGLAAYWNFNQVSGNTITDLSGNQNNGQLLSGAIVSGEGVGDRALVLDGVDDYVNAGTAASLEADNLLTIEAWINPVYPNNNEEIIVNKEGEYEIARFSDGSIRWAFANSNPGWQWISTGYIAPENQWTHIAVTYDAGVVKTYANGALVHTYNGSGAIGDTDSPNNEFQIGGRQGVTTVISKFKGQIDEVRVWNVARTQQEIQENMNRQLTGTQAGLVGYWNFDQVNLGTVLDLSGNKNNGQLLNGAKLTDFAKLDVSRREFQVNTTTNDSQEFASVTALSNGGFVITWTSYQNGSADVYGQIFDAKGNKGDNTEFLVNTTTDSSQNSASITALSNGGFVITWNSFYQNGSVDDVYGQIFDANGNKVGNTEFLVHTTTNSSQFGASITSLSNGGFVAIWTSDQNGSKDVYGQIFDANGNKVGNTEFLVNTTTNSSQLSASVTPLSNSGFVVTWTSDQNGDLDVYGQIFDANGNKVGNTEFLVNTTINDYQYQYDASITALSNGSFVVTWTSNQDRNVDHVYGQIFDANGNKIGNAEFLVSNTTYPSGGEYQASVTALTNGRFLVSWISQQSPLDVYSQIFDANGNKISSEFIVNSKDNYIKSNPSVTALSNDGFVVTWHSLFGQDGSLGGVYAQVFDPNQKFILGDSTHNFYGYGGNISNGLFVAPSGTPALISSFLLPDQNKIQVYGSDTQYLLASIQIDASGNITYQPNSEISETTILASQLLTSGLTQELKGKQATVLLYSAQGWTTESNPVNNQVYVVGVVAGIGISDNISLGLKETAKGKQGNIIFVSERNDSTHETSFTVNTVGTERDDPTLQGSSGADKLTGGGGNDILIGKEGSDYLDGGTGDDILQGNILVYDLNNAIVWGNGDGNNQLYGWEGSDRLWGSDGNDILDGGEGNDQLNAGPGQDTLDGGLGSDTIDGGEGNDTVTYAKTKTPVVVNLTTGTATGGDVLKNIENVIASQFADSVTGDTRANALEGLAGNDTLIGGEGNDTLKGGAGNDNLDAGAGNNILEAGGGADALKGGIGNDTYKFQSEWLSLEQAFVALGGDEQRLGKVTSTNGQLIDWNTFERFGFDAQYDKYQTLGLEIDLQKKQQNQPWVRLAIRQWLTPEQAFTILGGGNQQQNYITNPSTKEQISWSVFNGWVTTQNWVKLSAFGLTYSLDLKGLNQGWLSVPVAPALAGSKIKDDGGSDSLVLPEGVTLSLSRLYPGKTGLAQSGNDLIIDLNQDGVANPAQDLSIVDFFNNNGNQQGSGFIEAVLPALSFDGFDDYVTIADPGVSSLDISNAITVEAWIKGATTSVYGKILGKGSDASEVFALWLTSSGTLEVNHLINGLQRDFPSNVVIGDNIWHHVAYTYDGTTNKIYIDGVLQGSQAIPGTLGVNNEPISIGREVSSSTNAYTFKGNIDEVRIWNQARSQSDIQANMNRQLSGQEGGLAGYWKFNEGTGTTVYDVTNNKNNGSINGATWTTGAPFNSKEILNLAKDFTPITIPPLQTFNQVTNWQGSSDWGDYDNDGDLDLLIAGQDSYGNGIANIYRNNDGIFAAAVSIDGLDRIQSTKWGDYDNDGDLDLLLIGHDNLPLNNGQKIPAREYFAKIYLNKGNQAIQQFTVVESISLGKFENPEEFENISLSAVDWADYNNDGKLDILTSAQLLTKLTGGSLNSIDYNKDGFIDVIVTGLDANSQPTTLLYKGNGNRTFTPVSSSLIGLKNSTAAWGDFNNDGYFDLLLAGSNATNNDVIQLYKNNQNGTFSAFSTTLKPVSDSSLDWGDYNNDGKLDLLLTGTRNGQPITEVYQGNGSGGFTLVDNILMTSVQRGEAKWGDYDNDGDLDIIVTGAAGRDGLPFAQVYRHNLVNKKNTPPVKPEKQTPKLFVPTTVPIDYYRSPSVNLIWAKSAFDANEKTPVDALTYNLKVGTIIGGSDVLSPLYYTNDTGKEVRQINAIGNVGYGAVESGTGNKYWTINNLKPGVTYYWNVQAIDQGGTASSFGESIDRYFTVNFLDWKTPKSLVLFNTSNVNVTSVAGTIVWGDYDQDGKLDIVKNFTLYEYDSATANNLVFKQIATLPSVNNDEQTAVAWGDYDQDGDRDLLVIGKNGSTAFTRLYTNNNNQTFSYTTANLFPGVTASSVQWGDYNRDGKLDILLVGKNSTNQGIVSIYQQNSDRTFTPTATLTGGDFSSASWGDYNGDRYLDILVTGTVGKNNYSGIYRNNQGNFSNFNLNSYIESPNAFIRLGQVQGSYLPYTTGSWGDVNNDGLLDVLLAGSKGAIVYSFDLANSQPRKIDKLQIPVEQSIKNATWFDYNNDGLLDVTLTRDLNGTTKTEFYITSTDFEFNRVLTPTTEANGSVALIKDYDRDGRPEFFFDNGKVYQSLLEKTNTAPTAPTELSATIQNNAISLSWKVGTDKETPKDGLSYNLRIGTKPGGTDIIAPISLESLQQGSLIHQKSNNDTITWTLNNLNLPKGIYYWSIQTVDTAFTGSDFASERVFTIGELTTPEENVKISNPKVTKINNVAQTNTPSVLKNADKVELSFDVENTGKVSQNIDYQILLSQDNQIDASDINLKDIKYIVDPATGVGQVTGEITLAAGTSQIITKNIVIPSLFPGFTDKPQYILINVVNQNIETKIDDNLAPLQIQFTDPLFSAANTTLSTNIKNLILTGSSVINGTGNGLDNYIIGNTVSNTLNGAAGNDTLDGGDGNDTLIGSSGNDILIGGLGSDRLDGGDGIDTASYTNASASVTVNLALTTAQTGGEATGDILVNIENLLGSNFDDTLSGNSSNNILNGGFGSDSLTGGTDNDTYIVDSAGDIVTETSTIATEIDTVQTFVSYLLGDNLENLLLLGTDNIDGAGNNLNNTITGNSGNNILIGGLGSDRLDGVAGIDTASYINASAGVTVNLALTTAQTGGEATGDILQNIENLIGSNFNDTLSGNSGDNILIGGLGSDRLDGVAGIDTASYINASAAVTVNLALTTAQTGGEATGDILQNIENLIGSNFDDTLIGNNVNNILSGGAGGDSLSGGLGADRFVYSNSEDSLLAAPDRITDFNPSEGDRLVVNSPSSLPTALFNAGSFSIATYSTLSAAAIAAYADVNPNLAGTQPIAVKQAIFFGWNGGTYLSVNDSIAAFNASTDLLINVTGINGTLAAGSLTANNYFAA